MEDGVAAAVVHKSKSLSRFKVDLDHCCCCWSLFITSMILLASELIACISKFCLDEWQDILDRCRDNKLCAIYPSVCTVIHSKPPCTTQYFQIDCELITGTIGTHLYVLSSDDTLSCAFCGVPLTVKYIPLKCIHLRDSREKFFTFSSLKMLLWEYW